MSELQIGLIAVGALVVAAVIFHSRWQERKLQRRLEASLRVAHDDVLLTPTSEHYASQDRSLRMEESALLNASVSTPGDHAQRSEHPDTARNSDALDIDFTVHLEFSKKRVGQELINEAVRVLSTSPKSVQLHGLIADVGTWESMRHAAEYNAARMSLQLVDRRGCVSLGELVEFESVALRLASLLEATAHKEGVESAFERARRLDQFCTEVDIQVALHVIGMSVSGSQVLGIANSLGFTLEEDLRYRLRDDRGQVLLSLSMDETPEFHSGDLNLLRTSKLSIELDVPRVPDDVENYRLQCATATELAKALSGSVVDDRRNAVSQAAFELIGSEVNSAWRKMRNMGIPAGSALALRLFS